MNAARRIADLVLRPAIRAAAAMRGLVRGEQGPRSGAHAVAMTPEGRLVLVRLRYASGWRFPGGGRGEGESLIEVALRELREEIGLTAHGAVRPLDFVDPSLVLVEDVTYAPRRWSWEVERVIEADPDALPPGLAPITRRWIAALRRG